MIRRFVHATTATVLLGVFSLGLLAPSASASVPSLVWAPVSIPGDNDLTIVSPSEVTDIAAGMNGLVYAIDGQNGRVYRSLEYGLRWEDITKYLLRAGATLPATFIAVAPDNEGIVAAVTDGGTAVYASLDGGYEWEDVCLPALAGDVTALAISGLYRQDGREYREIAIGTASWGDNSSNGEVWILQGGCTWTGWRDQEIHIDPMLAGADVSSLVFSPAYARDNTLVVVASTGADAGVAWADRTWLVLGERNKATGTTDWAAFSGYPLELIGAGDGTAGVSVRSCLALPADFDSSVASLRNIFVSLDRTPDYDDDVYRVIGDSVSFPYGRMDVDGGADIDIWSIAYRGNRMTGVLLAGARAPIAPLALKTQVYRCGNPFDASPGWDEAEVEPTGPGHAMVAWAPNVSLAYCGTSSQPGAALDESAFSASNDGSRWRQMAIIDTALTLTDLAVCPDGARLFLTTSNQWGPESLWQSSSDPLGHRWERLLTIDSDSDAVMVRLSADYQNDQTLYAASHNSNLLAASYDSGSSWEWRKDSGEKLLDLVVVDATTICAAIPGGRVMNSLNGGRSWQEPVETQLAAVNMLSRAADGTLFAGSADGHVSYSEDGGSTWVLIDEPVGTGAVQVLPDVAFKDNRCVYATAMGADDGLWCWELGRSIYWQQLDEDMTDKGDGEVIGGLLGGNEGTLYALRTGLSGAPGAGMTRWLYPACRSCARPEYDDVTTGLPSSACFAAAGVFVTSPPVGAIWGDDLHNEVFAIDSCGQGIFVFSDTLCKRGPQLQSPVDGADLDANPCACNRDAVVAFDWEDVKDVERYEVSFYCQALPSLQLWSTLSDYDGYVASPAGDASRFDSGETYGWRVRAVEPVLSPWSDMWRMYPRLLAVSQLQPASGAIGVAALPVFTWDGPAMAEGYEFTLATSADFEHVVASFSGPTALRTTAWVCGQELEAGGNYFWRVRAISDQASSPWVTAAFTVAPAPAASAPAAPSVALSAGRPAVSEQLIWVMFSLVVLLFAAIIVLVFRTARRY